MQSKEQKIRVLVVDDSAVMRKLISNLLERDPNIEVVATAIDGDFALNKVEAVKPDVVTLDVDMPRMDGLTTLRHIVTNFKVPVVMLSSLTSRGAMLTMQALEIGAFDFVCKPKSAAQIGEMFEELIQKVKGAARSRTILFPLAAQLEPKEKKRSVGSEVRRKVPSRILRRNTKKVVVIGASSGGPHALRYLLPKIPTDLDAGILIVQHMMESFTSSFVRWLDEICEMEVLEARDGDLILPGRILVAPGPTHMKVRRTATGGEIVLEPGEPVSGHRPSVDVLFQSVATEYGSQAVALIMTGMGSDGAQGIGAIRRASGHTLAQDKESCSVFGMPRVAIENGHIDTVLPLKDIAGYLISVVGQQTRREECYV
ncbi:MAG: chemotaxis response regulator protein-glutamate methylesterase [Acidobacteria bacterium]|nr:chemotaxis response regulator protein-glutamate methylesterase [Acidobacteriota bacterium]